MCENKTMDWETFTNTVVHELVRLHALFDQTF